MAKNFGERLAELEKRIAEQDVRIKELEDIVEGKVSITLPAMPPSSSASLAPDFVMPEVTAPRQWQVREASGHLDYAMG